MAMSDPDPDPDQKPAADSQLISAMQNESQMSSNSLADTPRLLSEDGENGGVGGELVEMRLDGRESGRALPSLPAEVWMLIFEELLVSIGFYRLSSRTGVSPLLWNGYSVAEQWGILRSLRTLCQNADSAGSLVFFRIFALSSLRKSDCAGWLSERMWRIISTHTRLLSVEQLSMGFGDHLLLANNLLKCSNLSSFRYGVLDGKPDRLLCDTKFASSIIAAFTSNITGGEKLQIALSDSYLRISAGRSIHFIPYHGVCWESHLFHCDDLRCYEEQDRRNWTGKSRMKGPPRKEGSILEMLHIDLSISSVSAPEHIWGDQAPPIEHLIIDGDETSAESRFFASSWDASNLKSLTISGTSFETIFHAVEPDRFVNLHTIRFLLPSCVDDYFYDNLLYLRKLLRSMDQRNLTLEIAIMGTWWYYLPIDELLKVKKTLQHLTLLNHNDWSERSLERAISISDLKLLSDHFPLLSSLCIDLSLLVVSDFDQLFSLFNDGHFLSLGILELNVDIRIPDSFCVGNRIKNPSNYPDYDTVQYLFAGLTDYKQGFRFQHIRLLIYGRLILAEDGNLYDYRSWTANLNRETGEMEIEQGNVYELHEEEVSDTSGDDSE